MRRSKAFYSGVSFLFFKNWRGKINSSLSLYQPTISSRLFIFFPFRLPCKYFWFPPETRERSSPGVTHTPSKHRDALARNTLSLFKSFQWSTSAKCLKKQSSPKKKRLGTYFVIGLLINIVTLYRQLSKWHNRTKWQHVANKAIDSYGRMDGRFDRPWSRSVLWLPTVYAMVLRRILGISIGNRCLWW